jgi:hypothetical protein
MSINGNFKRLTNLGRIQVDCLNGIGFIVMGWVVLGHFLYLWYFYFGIILMTLMTGF